MYSRRPGLWRGRFVQIRRPGRQILRSRQGASDQSTGTAEPPEATADRQNGVEDLSTSHHQGVPLN